MRAPQRDNSAMSEEEDDATTMLPNLPDDVIVDILSRLPAASLGRFKCVSKPWNSLISSRKFIEMHLKKSSWYGEDCCKFRALMSAYPAWSLMCERLDDDVGEDDGKMIAQLPSSDSAFSPVKEMTGYDDSCDVIGSCNGLVCFNLEAEKSAEHSWIVWNPTTGEHRHMSEDAVESVVEIDEGRPPDFYHFSGYMETFGFGYDSNADDYKIVRITLQLERVYSELDEGVVRIDTLSVGSNKLVKIWDRIFGYFKSECGVFAGGALHWKLRKDGNTPSDGRFHILSFNLEKEKLEEQVMQIPNKDDTSTIPSISGLYKLCEKLAAVVVHISSDSSEEERSDSSEEELDYSVGNYEIWVMEEYGVTTSWTKLITIDGGVCSSFKPLYISRNEGALTVGSREEIMMYDPKKKTHRTLNIPGVSERKGPLDILCKLVYAESLVSPFTVPNPNWREEEI